MPNLLTKFFYRSFCDRVFAAVDFTGTTDYTSGSLTNVNDRDKTTCAITSGKNSDATKADFIIDLGAAKSIDTFAMWSNLKDFFVLYSTNGTDYICFPNNSETAFRIKVVITTLYSPLGEIHFKINSETEIVIHAGSIATKTAELLAAINAATGSVATADYVDSGNHALGIIISSASLFSLEITTPDISAGNATQEKAFVNTTLFFFEELTTPVSARYIKINATATITANEEKKIYELVVTEKICALPVSAISTLEQKYSRVNYQNIVGGSIQIVLFPQSPKLHAVLDFKNLTSRYAEYDALKDAFILDSCLVYLYYSDLIDQLGYAALYLVNDILEKSLPLSSEVLAAGVDGSLELLEV